jgi:CBS domain-containing protein
MVDTMTTIDQVMARPAQSLRPETSVLEAINFLTKHHSGSAPVVTAEGELVGMISELELLDVVFSATVKDEPISNYMSMEVQSIESSDPLTKAAQLFALYKFRRLPVMENGKLVGIIGRRDLMNYALRSSYVLTDPLVDLFPSLASVG